MPAAMIAATLIALSQPGPMPLEVQGQQQRPYEDLVCSFSWPCDQALRIMMCESGGDARATSPYGDRGLFQINPIHSARVGGNLGALYDPETNVAVAHALYQESPRGFSGPWVYCSRR